MAKNYSFLFAAVLVTVFANSMTQQREILIDDEGPLLKVDQEEYEGGNSIEEPAGHATCHLEYQVMKRVVGTCIKLGRTSQGCVAGNYLHPLHPDCM
ncbi:uncharacterized protein [Leptinotarsa decemlineata]|uniref:uncharacterized protein n=1 Tax=Leptinotarsa decemlineata TaxID=7539 RepID=UPI003D30635B